MRRNVTFTALTCGVLAGAVALTGPAATSIATAAPDTAAGVASARSKDATYATVLNGRLPANVTTNGKPGRLRGGSYAGYDPENPVARTWISGLDEGTWKRHSVRFVDVAGDRHKEAVVLLARTLGGVGWPNSIVVYDGNSRVLSGWDSGDALNAESRNGTSFSTMRARSLDVVVRGIDRGNEGGCCGTGRATFRLSKGANGKPKWTLINRR